MNHSQRHEKDASKSTEEKGEIKRERESMCVCVCVCVCVRVKTNTCVSPKLLILCLQVSIESPATAR